MKRRFLIRFFGGAVGLIGMVIASWIFAVMALAPNPVGANIDFVSIAEYILFATLFVNLVLVPGIFALVSKRVCNNTKGVFRFVGGEAIATFAGIVIWGALLFLLMFALSAATEGVI